MSLFYYLNDDHTVKACSCDEWANQFETMDRQLKVDKVKDLNVSTIWLGLNHNYFGGEPLLFETMIFKGHMESMGYCNRYSTWDEALEGHKKAIQWILDGCKND